MLCVNGKHADKKKNKNNKNKLLENFADKKRIMAETFDGVWRRRGRSKEEE
tara:strand:+ start:34230 stop:34382 length:153 start_codon:yes stop_codon:yes gene_type:complete